MLILKALSVGPMHGYGVGRRLGRLAAEPPRVEEGAPYPALYRLEERGRMGKSENDRRARLKCRQRRT